VSCQYYCVVPNLNPKHKKTGSDSNRKKKNKAFLPFRHNFIFLA